MRKYAKIHHISVSDREVDKDYSNRLAELGKLLHLNRRLGIKFDTLENFYRSLVMNGDSIKRGMKDTLLSDEVVRSRVVVGDPEIRSYLTKHHDTLDVPAMAHVHAIFTTNLATAELVERKIKHGDAFAALARRYSQDDSHVDGDMGFVSRDTLALPLAEAAFSERLHTVGPPIFANQQYAIIRIDERRPAVTATFANSRERIRRLLVIAHAPQVADRFLPELRRAATIVIFDPALQDAAPIPSPAAPETAPTDSS